jgi:hypothetical protein
MIILYLWAASAWVGLAVGFVFFRVLAIVLASPLVALLSAALLYHYGFGLVRVVSISMGLLLPSKAFICWVPP